jgi:hypothetical protein
MRAARLVRREAERESGGFVVYVEGPRDRNVLEAWARRLSPPLSRAFAGACVILGGRQPARAVDHLSSRRELLGSAEGLCILDGDTIAAPSPKACEGLEYFTWRRRHIESYLLVPAAIARTTGSSDGRLLRLLADELPDPGDERALLGFDAKRFLGPKGPLARLLGRPVPAGGIARAMRAEEIHEEVRSLCGRIAAGLGVLDREVTVQIRRATAPSSDEV